MKLKTRIRRTLLAGAVAATAFTAATAITSANAQPARADRYDCFIVILYANQILTEDRITYCDIGAGHQWSSYVICLDDMLDSGLSQQLSDEACYAAGL